MRLRNPETGIGVAIALLAVVAYWPSFDVAFFLDDFRIILENPMLQDPLDPAAVWNFSQARFVASWTLAANYALHADEVLGYHVVNFAVHLLAGFALFWLVKGLLRSQAGTEAPRWHRWAPWLAMAVFLLHPLQTQAVTYIVQRYSSMMAMFYLASLACFAWGRLRHSVPMLAASGAAMLLALLCKQSAATLPVALILVELLFFRRLSGPAWAATLALALAGFGALFALLHWPPLDIVGITRETDLVSRIDYLATQMEVLWRYIGLFLGIGDQRLEYALAFANGFERPETVLYALGHVVIIAIGARAWRRAPLIAFGILFYYLAHAVESSLFPIIDEAFEHRTYLPNAGLCIIVASALAGLAVAVRRYRAGALLVATLLLVLSGATFARNALWSDRIAFLERETELSPDSQRAWTSLGKELMREARFQAALDALREAERIAVEHQGGALRPPTLLNMIFALHYTGRHHEAIRRANATSLEPFNATERAFFFEARGRAQLELGALNAARTDLERSARLNPTPNAIAFLAETERRLGNRERAMQLARSVLDVSPGHPLARRILHQASP